MNFKRDKRFTQGIFKPENPDKLIGNKQPIFRSSWELRFFRWADRNANVLAWGSENIIIPYLSPLDSKVHRYFVDNFVVFAGCNGEREKFLIEIKPSKQLKQPSNDRKKTKTLLYEQKTWIINQVKWRAARDWAVKKGYKFIILTEKELGL